MKGVLKQKVLKSVEGSDIGLAQDLRDNTKNSEDVREALRFLTERQHMFSVWQNRSIGVRVLL